MMSIPLQETRSDPPQERGASVLQRVVPIGLAAGLVLTAAVHATQCSQAGVRATTSSSLDAKLSAAVARGDVPGLVVVAATRDRILYQGVFGKAEIGRSRPMTADAIFRIASMTKAVTSVAAMQLYEQGRFSLDDPAEKYLPELTHLMVFESFDNATGAYQVRPAATKVTIRHLFTHTSGLGYGFTSPIDRDFKPRNGENTRRARCSSNRERSGFTAPASIGSGGWWRSSPGKTLEEYFRDRIFTPLAMPDTFYNVPDAKQARLVTVHRRQDGRADAPLAELPNQPQRPATTFNGGGGLSSTASDYIRFERMILNGGTLDGARILSAATRRADGPESDRRRQCQGLEDRAARSQHGLHVHRRREGQVGAGISDHDAVRWRASGRQAASAGAVSTILTSGSIRRTASRASS